MSFYKFKRGDVLLNTFTARPEFNFFIYNQNRYINNKNVISGTYSSSVTNVPPGYVNLYELNINRASGSLIFPWMYAQENEYLRLSSMSKEAQKASASVTPPFAVSGTYPLSSSIQYYYYAASTTAIKPRLEAIRNTTNYYRGLSPHYVYSGSIPAYNTGVWRFRDLNTENVGLITIPAIVHGSELKKGSVSLKFYISGTLVGELVDSSQRGELRQVSGTLFANDNRIAGTVLYNEGLIVLTGSWALDSSHTEDYLGGGNVSPQWNYFGSTISGSAITTISSSYILNFQATEKIPNLTMLTYANRGQLNYSNNPTFLSSSKNNTPLTGSIGYFEQTDRPIKNIVSSSYTQTTGSFEKITYITKIAVYDQYKNLIGVANLANPVRKREEDSYTFKLKLDM